jgi:hypothetical protein
MIDGLITLQGKPKHKEGCPNRVGTNQPVLVDLRFGIRITVMGTKLSGMPHTVHPTSHMYSPPGCEPGR